MRYSRRSSSHAVVQPLQPVLRIGGIAADQVKGLVLQGNKPPLVVVLVQIHTIGCGDGSMGGEHRSAGVPLLLCGVPVLQDPLAQLHIRLSLLHFGLLETTEIGAFPLIELQKPLFQAGPQAIHIPRYEFHRFFLQSAK
jgi:hypothetical protein